MKESWRTRRVVVLVVVAIVFMLICGSITSIYNKNTQMMNDLSSGNTAFLEGTDEMIVELSKAKDMFLIEREAKLQAMSILSLNYFLKQDYASLIETSIQTIYLAERHDQPYYAAWNYINMSEVFMLMSEYEMAEKLIEKALEYKIGNKDRQDWINETAYIYLADLKAKNGKKEEAFKYIAESMKYADETDYDYKEMLLKRNGIKAQLALEEEDYLYAKALLDKYPMDVPEDALLMESVYLPVQEIYAKLYIAMGDVEEGVMRSDAILEHESAVGYEAKRLAFLTSLTELFEGKDEVLFSKYSGLAMDAYDDVMRQNAHVMSDYIFNIYTEEYRDNEDDELRNIYLMVSLLVVLIIFVLAFLVWTNRKKAMTDPLTGIDNRRAFDKIYSQYINKDAKIAVIMFDVDHFKKVNDNFGHEVGDEVLQRISKILNQEKPLRSKLFRMGGEEFCVIHKCDSVEAAVEAAENMRMKIEEYPWEHGSKVTISGGIAYAEPHEDLYSLADQQLYISKNNGRNQINYIKK